MEITLTVALELLLVLVALVTRFRFLELLQKMIVSMVSNNVINRKIDFKHFAGILRLNLQTVDLGYKNK